LSKPGGFFEKTLFHRQYKDIHNKNKYLHLSLKLFQLGRKSASLYQKWYNIITTRKGGRMNEIKPQKPLKQNSRDQLDIETKLHIELSRVENELAVVIANMADFYARRGGIDKAVLYLHKLLDFTEDPEQKANCLLKLGQLMERADNIVEAISYYKDAYALEPADKFLWYFINNNLGYCLNLLGHFEEAEPYCREAVKILPERHNAYKNLGISLVGLARYKEASEFFVKSVQLYPNDPRAFIHLKELVDKHPEIVNEVPDIKKQVENCLRLISSGKDTS
jgi:tetratricopeptide (TPR) repeat protein